MMISWYILKYFQQFYYLKQWYKHEFQTELKFYIYHCIWNSKQPKIGKMKKKQENLIPLYMKF